MNLAAQMSRAAFAQPLRKAWGTYLKHLNSSPVRTKAFTSVVGAVLGDAIAQRVSKPSNSRDWRFDWARTVRFAVFAGAIAAPLGHYWYMVLDSKVMPHAAKSPAAVVSKVALDQLVYAPACTPIFYLYKVASEKRASDFKQEVQDKFWPTLLAGYQLWPAAHLINFAFVPPEQRILYANVVSVAGTYLLSRAAAGDYSKKQPLGAEHAPAQVLGDGLVVSSEELEAAKAV